MTFLLPSTFMQDFVNYLGRTIKTQNAFYLPARDRKLSSVSWQAVTETAKSWRAKGETHGIPHRYGHHGSRRN